MACAQNCVIPCSSFMRNGAFSPDGECPIPTKIVAFHSFFRKSGKFRCPPAAYWQLFSWYVFRTDTSFRGYSLLLHNSVEQQFRGYSSPLLSMPTASVRFPDTCSADLAVLGFLGFLGIGWNINFHLFPILCLMNSFVGCQGLQKRSSPLPDKWVLSVLSVLSLVRQPIK